MVCSRTLQNAQALLQIVNGSTKQTRVHGAHTCGSKAFKRVLLSVLNNTTNIVQTTKCKQLSCLSLLSMASSFLTAPKPILFKTNAPSLPNSNQRPLLGTKFYSLHKLTLNPFCFCFCFYLNKHFLSGILFEWFFVSGS